MVRYFVSDVGVKVKRLEFKSFQVKLQQCENSYILQVRYSMNHISLIRFVVLKRPGFHSRKYGKPISTS